MFNNDLNISVIFGVANKNCCTVSLVFQPLTKVHSRIFHEVGEITNVHTYMVHIKPKPMVVGLTKPKTRPWPMCPLDTIRIYD